MSRHTSSGVRSVPPGSSGGPTIHQIAGTASTCSPLRPTPWLGPTAATKTTPCLRPSLSLCLCCLFRSHFGSSGEVSVQARLKPCPLPHTESPRGTRRMGTQQLYLAGEARNQFGTCLLDAVVQGPGEAFVKGCWHRSRRGSPLSPTTRNRQLLTKTTPCLCPSLSGVQVPRRLLRLTVRDPTHHFEQ